ncbi:helix-turn-helix domain-containing protein [Amycolatopsis sp. NPDC051061]|uniref:helix-turn-helix domain-containing protein n=1 Tax=Amycolatopsis sp. NPDC051061 TaxID=3155042 RepID=UPI0034284079
MASPGEQAATPPERLDVGQLATLVRQHRGNQSLRQAAADAGVSFSTLSRVEAGAQPDLASFTAICAWIGVPPSRFFTPVTERWDTPLEEAISHLNTDPRLKPEAASSIAAVIRQMYDVLAEEVEPPKALVACHLRAAPTMRPGVPDRLGPLLVDMHDGLRKLVEAGDV